MSHIRILKLKWQYSPMYQGLKLSFVVAYDQQRVMGKNNQLPWHLPDDLKHFKAKTAGKVILMGRKTYDSIGRPLPNRRNIILTRDLHFKVAGCEVIHQLEALEALCEPGTEVMVIGGAEIFKLLMPYVDHMELTEVAASVEGDIYFPEFDRKQWQETARVHHPIDAHHAYAFDFISLSRKN